MANYSDTNKQRAYVQLESSYGVIPNTGGTATLAGTDAFNFSELTIQPSRAYVQRPYKTGSLSQLSPSPRRRNATWSVRIPLMGSGAVGTKPDIDPFLQALFGKAGTVAAGASVTYDPDDASPSLTIWDFNRPATMTQRAIFGAIVQRMRLSWGQDFVDVEFSGEGKWVIDSDQYADVGTETAAKGGLTAWPDEPASQTYIGTELAGYKGTITLDGNVYSDLRSGSLEFSVARELRKNQWNSNYPGAPKNGMRSVVCDISLDDDDSANTKALKGKAHNGTLVDFSIVLGETAGNIYTLSPKRILLPEPVFDYGDTRRGLTFSGCQASASAAGAIDEFRMVHT